MIFLHQILSSLSVPFHNVRYHHPFLYTKSLRVIPLHYHPPYAIYCHVLVNFTPPISFLFHSIFSTTISLVQITFISCELYFLSSLSRHPPFLLSLFSQVMNLLCDLNTFLPTSASSPQSFIGIASQYIYCTFTLFWHLLSRGPDLEQFLIPLVFKFPRVIYCHCSRPALSLHLFN